jgi:transmembrane sensor
MDNNDFCNDSELNDLLSDRSFRMWVLNSESEQSVFWESWLVQNPEKKEKVKHARIILKSFQFKETQITDKEIDSLLNRIKDTNATREKRKPRQAKVILLHEGSPNIKQKKRKIPIGYLLRYAAILGGALIFALSANLIIESLPGKTEDLLVEKVNEKGQKSIIYLSDGTVVNLNSSSKLVYPKVFEKEVRKVFLEGEAFFEVTKSNKPFIVQTEQLNTKVLGTSFNIRAFPAHEEHSVSLVTGKVLVYPPQDVRQHLILKPGEKGEIKRKAGVLLKTKFDLDQEVAWKDGILLFKELPFEEALNRIENWYGVEFSLDHPPQGNYLVTGRFANESLENVLASIGFTMKFNHQIKGNKVNLKFEK